MANNCFYDLKIVGKPDNIATFIKRLKGEDTKNNFGRLFSVDVYDEADDKSWATVCGDCAWSVECAFQKVPTENGMEDMLAINTHELNLTVEVWSEEVGEAFQEHLLYDKGFKKIDETRKIVSYIWDRTEFPTFEEYKAEICMPGEEDNFPKEEDFEDESLTFGGFENFNEYFI